MSAMADLLALAIVGYLFLYIFKYTRIGISQKSGYQVLFLSSIVGVLIVIFSQTVGKHIIAKWDIKLCMGVIRLYDMAIAAALAITFRVIVWAVDICISIKRTTIKRTWDKIIRKLKKIKGNFRDLDFHILKWQGDDNLVKIFLHEIELVEIYTRMNSKYVGIVNSAPAINSNRSGDVDLLTRFEVRIDAGTGKETTTDYFSPAFKQKKEKIFMQKLWEMSKTKKSVPDKENIEKIEKESDEQAAKEATRELPQIIVPLAEIVAVKKMMPQKDAVPDKRQPATEENTKATTHPPS